MIFAICVVTHVAENTRIVPTKFRKSLLKGPSIQNFSRPTAWPLQLFVTLLFAKLYTYSFTKVGPDVTKIIWLRHSHRDIPISQFKYILLCKITLLRSYIYYLFYTDCHTFGHQEVQLRPFIYKYFEHNLTFDYS